MGLNCVEIGNRLLSLIVAESVGPRILSLSFNGSDNLFAEIPDVVLDCPDVGKLRLFGGHRLWVAPELPQRTYLPDAHHVMLDEVENGVCVTQKADASGIEKSLTLTLPDQSATVVVEHRLTNRSMWAIECAAWAITQMATGGTGILPQNTEPIDAGGYWGNRPITLWPYTDINSPHLTLANDRLLVHANINSGGEALKIGAPNPAGWLSYWKDGLLFTKEAAYDPTASYYDFASSSQIYCNSQFLELETLSPISTIAPNQTLVHREIWRVVEAASIESAFESRRATQV